MALILNDDEQQFGDSVRRFVTERSPLTKLRELMSSGQPYDQDAWKQLSALGLPGLVIPASYGGAEAGFCVLTVALTELGGGLVASPLLAGTLAAGVLGRLGDDDVEAAGARTLNAERSLEGIRNCILLGTAAGA